jgi:hypothetical protein
VENKQILGTSLQRVILGSVTKQSSNGRIVVQMRMPLDADSLGTLPDWAARAYEDVSEKYTDVDPEVQEMSDLAIAFSNDNNAGVMFAKRAVKVASASLRGFKVTRVGKPDEPEVELQFKLYLQFAREFWAWAGEMAGEEVYMTFPTPKADQGPVAQTAELPLQAAEAAEEPRTALPALPTLQEATGEAEPAPDTGPARKPKAGKAKTPGKKSDASNLREFHQKEVQAGRAIN